MQVQQRSFFEQDLAADAIVQSFLDAHFYDKIAPKAFFYRERVEDKTRQHLGIDYIIGNRKYKWFANIDEKASSHYANSELSNFTFELLSWKDGHWNIGWLLNDEMLTDYYVLSWIHLDKEKFPLTKKENDYFKWFQEPDICYLIVCVLKCKDVKTYLENCGFSRDTLLEKAKFMVANQQWADYRYRDKYGIWFRYSTDSYKERPVNVIIKKEVLNQLAWMNGQHACYKVTKDNVEEIPYLP